MPTAHELLSQQFQEWEVRGRGWPVFPYPVAVEPPFRPFEDHFLPAERAVDDGHRPTLLSSFFAKLSGKLKNPPPVPEPSFEPEEEPEPFVRDSLEELQVILPEQLKLHREGFEHFLLSLSRCREPMAFELLGVQGQVALQFACGEEDAPLLRRQLAAHFPEALVQAQPGALAEAWERTSEDETLIVEFGLAREFMLPLASGSFDPFVGMAGALSGLEEDELSLFQVLFQPARAEWAKSILYSACHADGSAFFVNRPELAEGARNKIKRPLFAAVVRMAVKSGSYERTRQLALDLAGALSLHAHPQGNELIPLENTDYPFEEHVEDVLLRQTRRSGMLLNSEELLGFVHLPSEVVRAPGFARMTGRTKAAPESVQQSRGLLLGANVHARQSTPIRLSAEQRTRHLHCIGASGTGKSTFLRNLITQDIANGEGLAVLDPHGDLIDQILGVIPEHRIKDVILLDPSDETAAIGFNVLSAHSDLEKTLLASDLVSVFRRLSQAWGDQMEGVLRNAILAFLESTRGGTLSDLRRFLLDAKYREKFLPTVQDADLRFYWEKGFTQLSGNKSIGPVLTRLETFLSPKPLRYLVAQKSNRLDFARMLDEGKIFLAKLSEGAIGKENAHLLGSLLMAKLQQTAMARQRMAAGVRKDFWIYLDEFQNFITPSLAEILSGARKYRIGLTLAHQELRHLERDREVASAVMSNPGTRVVFRVGDADARALEHGFAHFTARDLQNLGTGEAIVRVERSNFDFNLSVPFPTDIDPAQAAERRSAVIAASRKTYATPRADIEAELRKQFESEEAERAPAKPTRAEKPTQPAPEDSPKPSSVQTIPTTPSQAPASPPSPAASTTPAAPQFSSAAMPQTKAPEPNAAEPTESFKSAEPAARADGVEETTRQHEAVKKQIMAEAEALGFTAKWEHTVLGGKGRVDVALERGSMTIACEVSVTTTIEHEVGNVLKCLQAGFQHVAVICSSQRRLDGLRQAVEGNLSKNDQPKIGYYLPNDFIRAMQEWAAKEPNPGGSRKRSNLQFSTPAMTEGERMQKEKAMLSEIAARLKRKTSESGE